MSSRTNVPNVVVAEHLVDIMPGLTKAIHEAFHGFTSAWGDAIHAAFNGDTEPLVHLREEFRVVATVIPPLDGKFYRVRVECYAGQRLHYTKTHYGLTLEQAEHDAGVING